jgi:hypothetical protein
VKRAKTDAKVQRASIARTAVKAASACARREVISGANSAFGLRRKRASVCAQAADKANAPTLADDDLSVCATPDTTEVLALLGKSNCACSWPMKRTKDASNAASTRGNTPCLPSGSSSRKRAKASASSGVTSGPSGKDVGVAGKSGLDMGEEELPNCTDKPRAHRIVHNGRRSLILSVRAAVNLRCCGRTASQLLHGASVQSSAMLAAKKVSR